ncbi:MAG: antibiotic biosynthesis monooxygenase [Anaerolineaceae bacterium]|nr:antibiotic biosynthesis monooxygenase [Anaerolineaceae bacterium]
MIMHMTIRQPEPDKEEALLAAMHNFGLKVRGRPGIMGAHTLKDMDSGCLVEVVVWANKEAYLIAQPEVERFENFADLEIAQPKVYHLEEI